MMKQVNLTEMSECSTIVKLIVKQIREDNLNRTEKEAESNEKRRRFVKFKSSSEEEDATESNEDRGDKETEEMIESDSEEEIRGSL